MTTTGVNFRLTESDGAVLTELSRRLGVSKQEVLRRSLHAFDERERREAEVGVALEEIRRDYGGALDRLGRM